MLKQLFVAVSLGSALLGVMGCAKEEFRRNTFEASASAVGFRYLPAKVDIVMVTDNSASLNYAFSTVQSQLAGFAGGMRGQYWDYHLAKIAIINPTEINRVLVNPEFNSPYLKDGTLNPDPTGIVPADRAVNDPSQFSLLDTVYATGAGDPTFTNMISKLQNAKADTYTGFLRPDALLAIVVVTNGYDSSVDSDPYNGATDNTSKLAQYAQSITNLKGSNKLIRFYPVASYGYKANNCLVPSGAAYQGIAYFDMMTQYFPNGLPLYKGATPTLDFCSYDALSNVLGNIASNLETVRQAYVYSNIVLDEQPVAESIQVMKNGSALARSNTNGFSYPCDTCDASGKGTVYTVTGIYDEKTGTISPISLNRRTGYVIQLNGSGRMIGTDTPDVTFEKR